MINKKDLNNVLEDLVGNKIDIEFHKYIDNTKKIELYYKIGSMLSRMNFKDYVRNIKEISNKLMSSCGYSDDYDIVSLNNMKIFYERIPDLSILPMFLNWEYYQLLILVDSYEQFVYYLNLTIIDDLDIKELKTKIMSDDYNKASKKKRNKFVNGGNIIDVDVAKYILDSVKKYN